ncbi:MAG: Zn-ribbon domain-containing OB-fold protein [Gammaproteobacteria bacterium]|nr:Zn-ribbon domain-containing OB-fold protein [Gammaproteobacteria bacterium]MDH3371889.1 Zn-ribbon domain-containing OB-fold protein [Gammaproteobacteria bacterium]MDH3407782.1 Zn-ribbon domain-containing OB-fold protein [Gammaproteobacteria bacterium]MDH3551439.1 Zn-ribbon domain-containing OB-fold protein [Gammaproteobacteria bacterium]
MGAKSSQRIRPVENYDSAHFWQGLRDGKLLIQECGACGLRRHPPQPMCEQCQSLDWTTVESSGRGTIYSYTVIHYPEIPPFEYPNAIVLVDLDEGVRLASQLRGADPDDIAIGQRVIAKLVDVQDDLTLPVFEIAP